MKKFDTTFMGYDKSQVNKFVSEVTDSYEDILNKLKARDKEMVSLREELIKYQNIEKTLNRAILIAEETNNQMKYTTKLEADNILNDAKKNASRIINDALLKAEKAEADADELKRRIEIYKNRVKQIMKEERELIDHIGDDID